MRQRADCRCVDVPGLRRRVGRLQTAAARAAEKTGPSTASLTKSLLVACAPASCYPCGAGRLPAAGVVSRSASLGFSVTSTQAARQSGQATTAPQPSRAGADRRWKTG